VALIVEVLRPGRGGEVRERVRPGADPLTIGRALDNALVLDDPHVDAHHARLVRDAEGALTLEDLGSVNRIETRGDGHRDRVAVAHGTTVVLGRTTLRFRDEQGVVPAAIPLHGATVAGETPARWYERPAARLGIVAAAIAVAALDSWLGATERGAASAVFSTVLVASAVAVVWAGVWAVVARAVLGQFRLLAHVAVVAFAFTSYALIEFADGWSAFLFPSVTVFAGIKGLVLVVLFAAILVGHLGSATTLARPHRWRIGAAAGAIILLLLGISGALKDEAFTAAAEFSGVIKPVSTALLPTESAEEFSRSIADLRGEIDSLLVVRDR